MGKLINGVELQPYTHGWKGKLSNESAKFFGKGILLSFETWTYPEKNQSPPNIDSRHVDLAKFILDSLTILLPVIEREFTEYQKEINFDKSSDTIKDPTIFLSNENLEESDTKWSFIVERSDWQDFGIHLEFEGSQFLESWAAD